MSLDTLLETGEKIYFDKYKESLEKEYLGSYIVIDVDSEKYVINNDKLKAFEEAKNNRATVVMLLPVRSDTKWWHKYVMKSNSLTFIKGRLKFGSATSSAPFPSCVVEIHPWLSNSPAIFTMDNK